MTRLFALAAAAALAVGGAAGRADAQTPAAGAPGLTLTAAIDRALSANPTIAAARLQHPIDVAGIAVAAERPNPEIAYEASRETPHQAIGATLPLELGGKRQRRLDLANATVAVGDAELARVITTLRNDVRRAYFEVVAADLHVRIAGDVATLAQRARDAANARVQAGEVPGSDLTLSDLALANARGDLIAARGEATATRAELNALLGQPAGAPIAPSDSLASGVLPTADAALSQATASNADIQVLDRRIAEQKAKLAVAQSLTTPDVAVGGALAVDSPPEFQYGWRLSFGVTLPVFTTHKAGIVVEEATLARLTKEREAAVAQLSGGVAAALARAAAARDQMNDYQTTVLPLAQEAERQAQVAYTGGQIGLPALVQALQTARETRQRGLDAGLAYQKALSDLDKAIGAVVR